MGFETSIAIGSDGLPIVSYRDGSDTNLKFVHCGVVDCSAGNVAVTLDSDVAIGFDSSLTIGVDGLPMISYHDGDDGDLEFVHCGNVGCTNGNSVQTIDSEGSVGSDTAITIGSDGLPIISYRDATDGNLKVVRLSSETGIPFFRRR